MIKHFEVLRNSPEKYEKCCYFNTSNGRGMRSTELIYPIFKRNLFFFSQHIILPSFIKIGQELFEIIDQQIYIQTDTQTHRHIYADENNGGVLYVRSSVC